MENEKTLLIIADEITNHFGKLKQLNTIGKNQEYLIEYSIYDAIKAGFTNVVFIIKKDIYNLFKKIIEERIKINIKIEYVLKDPSYIPKKYQEFINKKQGLLGTGYTIYCAKDKIKGNFAVININTYYGKDAFLKAAKYFDNIIYNHYGIIGYTLNNTITSNKEVKREICKIEDDQLKSLNLMRVIKRKNKYISANIKTNEGKEISKDTIVSMNLLLLSSDIFKVLEEKLLLFLSLYQKNLSEVKFTILDVLDMCVKKNLKTIDVILTSSTCYELNSKEDIKNITKILTEEELYPQPLWINHN